jgi:hypothetical protein
MKLDESAGRRRHAAADGKPHALRLVDNAVAFDTLQPQHKAIGLLAFVAQLDKARDRDAVGGKAQNGMLDQRGFECRDGKARADGEKSERQNEGNRPIAQKHHGCRSHSRRQQGRPGGRLVIGSKIKNDAAAKGDREPGEQPPGANFGGSPGADARRHSEADLRPNARPAPLRAAKGPSPHAGARPTLRRP